MRKADYWEDSARMEAGFRKYVHRDVDHKRLSEKQAKKEKKLKRELGEGLQQVFRSGFLQLNWRVAGYVPPESTPEKDAEKEVDESQKVEPPQHVYEIYATWLGQAGKPGVFHRTADLL